MNSEETGIDISCPEAQHSEAHQDHRIAEDENIEGEINIISKVSGPGSTYIDGMHFIIDSSSRRRWIVPNAYNALLRQLVMFDSVIVYNIPKLNGVNHSMKRESKDSTVTPAAFFGCAVLWADRDYSTVSVFPAFSVLTPVGHEPWNT